MLMRALAVAALAITIGNQALAQERALAIGTAAAGGFLYPLGGSIAKVISETVENVEVTAEATGGSVENLKLTGSDPTYMGLAGSDSAFDAVHGKNKFDGNPQPVQTLMVILPTHFYMVTTTATGIDEIADVKGRRISTNVPGSGIEVTALRLLTLAGIDPEKDVTREKMSIGDSTAALKDGKIDAFFMTGTSVSAPLIDLAATPGLTMKLIPTDTYSDKLNEQFGQVYTRGVIPAGTYPGVDVDVPVQDTWNLLVAHQDLSEEDAYNFVKAVFENKDQLVAVVKDAAALSIENQVAPKNPIAFHPGALKYFAEHGLSTQ